MACWTVLSGERKPAVPPFLGGQAGRDKVGAEEEQSAPVQGKQVAPEARAWPDPDAKVEQLAPAPMKPRRPG